MMMRMADGKLRDMAEISPVISAIREFDALRVYVNKGDHAIEAKVIAAAKEAMEHARTN